MKCCRGSWRTNRGVHYGSRGFFAVYKSRQRPVSFTLLRTDCEGRQVWVRWIGNNSRKYDQKVEDVPAQCVLDEDRPSSVGRTVQVRLGHRTRARIWQGTVIQSLPPPSALELVLPAKRARTRKQRYVMYCTCLHICTGTCCVIVEICMYTCIIKLMHLCRNGSRK